MRPAFIGARDTGNALLRLFDGFHIERPRIDERVRLHRHTRRNPEFMDTGAARHDEHEIAFLDLVFFSDDFMDFRKFVRRNYGANFQKPHGAIQAVDVVRKRKRPSFVDANPFVASIAEMQRPIIGIDHVLEIIIVLMIVKNCSRSLSHFRSPFQTFIILFSNFSARR